MRGIPVDCRPGLLSSTRKVFIVRLFDGAAWAMALADVRAGKVYS